MKIVGESEPLNKLKEALSSRDSFTKHYLVRKQKINVIVLLVHLL